MTASHPARDQLSVLQHPHPKGSLLDRVVERTPLEGHDGRSGARLDRVTLADGTRLVVKHATASSDLAMRVTDDPVGRELALWRDGVLDRRTRESTSAR
jgi:hypothetical protein